MLGIILVVLVLGGLAFYQYSVSNTQQQKSSDSNQQNTDQEDNNTAEVQIEGIEFNGSDTSGGEGDSGPQGGLIVCVYKCGDGICQKDNVSCDANDMNCICQESIQECPQDCKE